MENLKLLGRMQVLNKTPLILADVAHNAQSVKYLAQHLDKNQNGKTYAIFSAFRDKDLCELIKPMQTLIDQWYILKLKNPRAASLDELKSALNQNQIHDIEIINDFKQTYEQIKAKLNKEDRLIIFGSFALVSQFITCHNK